MNDALFISREALDRLDDWMLDERNVGRFRAVWLPMNRRNRVYGFEYPHQLGAGDTLREALADARWMNPELIGGVA